MIIDKSFWLRDGVYLITILLLLLSLLVVVTSVSNEISDCNNYWQQQYYSCCEVYKPMYYVDDNDVIDHDHFNINFSEVFKNGIES